MRGAFGRNAEGFFYREKQKKEVIPLNEEVKKKPEKKERTYNTQNLRPVRNKKEARERGLVGGKRSGVVRKQKKMLTEALKTLLNGKYEIDGEKIDGYTAISLAQVQQAIKGDTTAFKEIRDMVEGKPVEKKEVEAEIKITFKGDAGDYGN